MPLSLSRTLAFGALAGVSAMAGYLFGSRERELDVANRTETIVSSDPATHEKSNTDLLQASDLNDEPHPGQLTREQFRERLAAIAQYDRAGVRRWRYIQMLRAMTAEEAPAIFAELRDDDSQKDRVQLLTTFFRYWGELDGPAALAAAGELNSRERARSSACALAGWAQTDPEQAWERTVELATDWPEVAGSIEFVVNALVGHGLSSTIAKYGDIPGQRAQYSFRRIVINRATANGQLDTVLHEVMGLDSVETQKAWIGDLFSKWGEAESDAPLAALSRLADPVLAQNAMTGFLGGWANVDPMGAVDYVLTHREEPMVGDSLASVAQQAIVNGDRERTLEVIERVAAIGELDNLAPAMMSPVALANPQMALQMAGMLSDEQQQSRYTTLAMSNWARSDFKAAADHVEQMPPGNPKLETVRSLASLALQREDGGATISRWVNSLPEGKDRANVVDRLLLGISNPRSDASDDSRAVVLKLAQTTLGLSSQSQQILEQLQQNPQTPTPAGTAP